MTKKEAIRQTEQERVLMSLGFTAEEAEQLRRISMTLHRWYEGECGSDDRCIVRGRKDANGEFQYDDDGDPYLESAGRSGPHRYWKIQDREKGAIRRLNQIIANRNIRTATFAGQSDRVYQRRLKQTRVVPYLQTDPRGAALYIIRPGDVPEGSDVSAYYSMGICVY